MPFLVPRTYCPICYEVVRTRFYNSASVVYFCFTLYKTTGDTIYFAYGGLMGTVIAVINIWALMGFFPGGYVPGQPNAEAIFLDDQCVGCFVCLFHAVSQFGWQHQSVWSDNFRLVLDGCAEPSCCHGLRTQFRDQVER